MITARHIFSKRSINAALLYACMCLISQVSFAEQTAFEIYGQTTPMKTLLDTEQSRFFRVEKEKYNLINSIAEQEYLKAFWKKEGKKKKITPDAAKEVYLAAKVKVDPKEVNDVLSKYENHPRLKDLPQKEKENVIREQLQARGEQEVMMTILADGKSKGNLKILYPEPEEPVVDFKITSADPVRYGPKPDQITPLKGGCVGDSCPITMVEVSEIECPFCARALPTTLKVMQKYAGKIRWVVRDFPLSHHERARPSAIAARCAGEQNKYWEMFETMFQNQRKLSDTDLEGYAKKIGLNIANYQACIAKPEKYNKMIDENIAKSAEAGVTGTPAFFINGVLLSGAQPYEEFEKLIEKQLKKVNVAKKGA